MDLGGEVVVLPAGVSQVCDLDLESLRKAAFGVIERDLMLEFLKQLFHCLLGLHCLFLMFGFGLFLLFSLLLATLLVKL